MLIRHILSFPLAEYDDTVHGAVLRRIHDAATNAQDLIASIRPRLVQEVIDAFANSDQISLFSRMIAELIVDIANSRNQAADMVKSAPYINCYLWLARCLRLPLPLQDRHAAMIERIQSLPFKYMASEPVPYIQDLHIPSSDEARDAMMRVGLQIGSVETFSTPGAVSHLLNAIEVVMTFSTQSEDRDAMMADIDEFCEGNAETLIALLLNGLRAGLNPPLQVTRVAVDLATVCKRHLSFESRFYDLPRFLQSAIGTVEQYLDGQIMFEIPQGQAMVDLVLEKMRTFTRLELLNEVYVEFVESAAEGIDGPRREWLSRTLATMKDPAYGLFEYTDDRQVLLRPVALGEGRESVIEKLRIFARVVGLAFRYGVTPGLSLAPSAIWLINHRDPPRAVDINHFMELEDPVFRSSVERMAELESAELADQGFTFDGLLPGGEGMPVNASNVVDFIELKKRHKVFDSQTEAMLAFAEGISDTIRIVVLESLYHTELTEMLRGEMHIDTAELMAHTSWNVAGRKAKNRMGIAKGGVDQISWLRKVLKEFDDAMMHKFLAFVSGADMAPIGGFTPPSDDRGWLHIVVDPAMDSLKLPTSQTCFISLRIPAYPSRKVLRQKLIMAINNADTIELH